MKTQLNEELNSIKYLFEYQRGRVISEEMTYYYKGFDGKVGSQTSPFLPIGAKAITQDEFNKASSGGVDLFNRVNSNMSKITQPVQEPQVAQQPQVKPVSTATNIQNKLVELGKNIGPTGADGKIGPNTINAIWDTIKDIQK
jgi:hypothetical protein